jgi:hypothetical protein
MRNVGVEKKNSGFLMHNNPVETLNYKLIVVIAK